VIDSYTHEAGVRNLEREISLDHPRHRGEGRRGRDLDGHGRQGRDVPDYLGPQKFLPEVAERTAEPGVATGLAWTPVGGEIMFIEATPDARQGRADAHRPARRRDERVGPGGDELRQEPPERARHRDLRGHRERNDIHVHVPAGAIPKDGPSAGVAMFSAITSLLTKMCVRPDVAMTGEITLRGLVLPVGGSRRRCSRRTGLGIKRIVLPERNEKDVVDVPEEIRQEMEILYVKNVMDVFDRVLVHADDASSE
jgi:ATP-dependent Lon protease